jgi:hypothetical protein
MHLTESHIVRLPPEQGGSYQFNGSFVATRAANDQFGPLVILAALQMLKVEVKTQGGLDYLQVFEIEGRRLWFIDDVEVVTALLPDDY